ncbi:hypothetical protein F5Y14DRAFT_458049 [Nemania sp. NC0429]|nr:hypothetical protein F5Y14DRAFT_458049 [Nemania sp. NC0429]
MVPPSPLRSHQASLERVMDFSTEPPLGIDQRSVAKDIFNCIIDYFNTDDPSNRNPYNRSQLIRCTYQYALSKRSRDDLLRAFFRAMTLSVDNYDDFNFDELRSKFFGFADYLLDNLFFTLACTKKTPQSTLTYHPALQEAQGVAHGFVGTPARVSTLNSMCTKATNRFARDNDGARDDDGNLLEGEPLDSLEVAHILPHALTKVNTDHESDSAREVGSAVLDMFDHGVKHLIEGTDVDRPRNALTVTA